MIPFCHMKYTLKNKDIPYCLLVYTGGIVLQKNIQASFSPVQSKGVRCSSRMNQFKEPALSSEQRGPVPILESFFCV